MDKYSRSFLIDEYYSGALFFVGEDKIMLQQRDLLAPKNPGLISLFGGGAEIGESPIQCLIREIREELCFDIQVDKTEMLLHIVKHENNGSYTLCSIYKNVQVSMDTVETITFKEGSCYLHNLKEPLSERMTPLCRHIIESFVEKL